MCRYKPKYFEEDWEDGKPVLSEAGKKAVEDEAKRGKDSTPTPTSPSIAPSI